MKVNCNQMRAFCKLLEAVGPEHIFKFTDTGIVVDSIDGANTSFGQFLYPGESATGTYGIEVAKLSKILPKEVLEVNIEPAPTWIITGGDGDTFKATMRTIDPSTIRTFKVGQNVPQPDDEPDVDVSPQEMYERIGDLKAAVPNQVKVAIFTELDKPCQVFFRASEDAGDSVQKMIVTPTVLKVPIDQLYSYDMILPYLNVLRLSCERLHLRFKKSSGPESLLFLVGGTKDGISYKIGITPMVKS